MRFLSTILFLIFQVISQSAWSGPTFKATTYNMGLAHTFVPFAKQRVEHLEKELLSYETDILCLQEVWERGDQKTFRKRLKSKYPYSFSTQIKNYRIGPRPTCKARELFGKGKFVSCMKDQCGEESGDDFTACIIDNCEQALEGLKKANRTCASALMAQVGKNPVLSMAQLLNPLWRAGQFAYKGSNGLMLFSKYPLKKKRYIDLKEISTLNRRGALEAQVEIEGRKITVMCLHASADLSGTAPYAGPFQTWAQENSSQLSTLLKETNRSVLPTVLMGDFNCGAGNFLAGIAPELPRNCKQVTGYGFSDPLSEMTKKCTFCNDNLLNEGNEESFALDHIFLKYLKPIKERVLFKDIITIETSEGERQTQLSDHYGYEVEVELP